MRPAQRPPLIEAGRRGAFFQNPVQLLQSLAQLFQQRVHRGKLAHVERLAQAFAFGLRQGRKQSLERSAVGVGVGVGTGRGGGGVKREGEREEGEGNERVGGLEKSRGDFWTWRYPEVGDGAAAVAGTNPLDFRVDLIG